VRAFESRMTRKEVKGTKGDVSCFVAFAPFVVFVFQSPPPTRSSTSSKPSVSLSNARGYGLAD
jgi:hypothetical protein